jgi:CHAD domain-containing protein
VTSAAPRIPDERAQPLLRQRIRALFKQLPKGLAGDEEAIHQMRVAGRRLRAALPLLTVKPEGKRVRRALRVLRDLTQAAGHSRDLDVSLDLLETHLDHPQGPVGEDPGVETRGTETPDAETPTGGPTTEQRKMRQRLRSARTRSRGLMAEGLMDLEIARLRRDLRRVLSRGACDLFTVMARVRAARDLRGEALLQSFAALGDRYDPEALHAVRRQARRLRYIAEVHDALLRDEPSEAPDLFKELQDRVGAIHDLHVLAGWLEARGNAARELQHPAEAEAAFTLQAHFDARGRELHRQFLEARPAETVARALAALGRTRTAA